MDSLEDEALDILKEIQETEEYGMYTLKLHNKFLDALAEIAAKNGIDKMAFYDEAAKEIPYEPDLQLNDDGTEGGHKSEAGNKDKTNERFWKNKDKVTKVLRFVNASYSFIKNVSDCLGAMDSD